MLTYLALVALVDLVLSEMTYYELPRALQVLLVQIDRYHRLSNLTSTLLPLRNVYSTSLLNFLLEKDTVLYRGLIAFNKLV